MKISLTDFVDFISKSASTKLTKVREIKNRAKYDPMTDYWKKLKAAIIDIHKESRSSDELDKIVSQLKPSDRRNANYSEVIKAYKSFLGRKKIKWFVPGSKVWKYNSVEISVSPELGLDINGQKHIIKLHLKNDVLTKSKADLVLTLMREALQSNSSSAVISILDVQRKKMFIETNLKDDYSPLLKGEAAYFEQVWNSI